MAMERVRSSSIAAALLLLTLVVLAAASAGAGGDDAAAAAAVEQERSYSYPLADDEPYELITFQNRDGEEIRLLADQRSESELVSVYGFANRSGHWFYSIRHREEGKHRRLPLPFSQSKDSRSHAEGLWNTLGGLSNTSAASDDGGDSDPAAANDDDERYMVLGMQTSGGDKIRLLVVAGQRYFFVTGFARGFFRCPNWSFREGERHRLLTTLGNGGSSHAEVVASNVLAALMKEARAAS